MPTLGAPLEFAKYEGRNFRAHILGAAPGSPVTGQMYFNSGDNTLYWFDGTAWQSAKGGVSSIPDASTSVKGIVQLTGDLAGTATNPQIAPGVITDSDINSANKDGAAGTPSLRTLGTGPNQAASGSDGRFTDARAPTAHRSTHEPGGSDPLTVDAAAATGSLRSLGAGAQQAMPGNRTLDAISPPATTVNLNGKLISALADPVASTDAANKNYVDNTAQGLDAKPSVRAATNTNLALSGAQTIDGVPVTPGDRVLVKDQTAQPQNGIYIVAAGAWTRAPDANTWTELVSAFTFVETGTINADSGWVSTVDPGGTIDTTAVTFVQFSGAGQVTAGQGLTKTGNILDVGAGAGITVNADSIQVANDGITNAMLANGAVNIATADVTGTLPVANGGTGQTAAKAARETGIGAAGYYSSATHGGGPTISIPQATHGLRASRGLMVQVQNEADGAVELPDVVVSASGDVAVTYGASVSANSKRVTVIG